VLIEVIAEAEPEQFLITLTLLYEEIGASVFIVDYGDFTVAAYLLQENTEKNWSR
jgi:hypothetical protein